MEARGEIFTVPAEKGDARNLTSSPGSAERDPAWSPDGKWISWFSDASGEYKLVIASQDGTTKRAIALPEPSHFYTPEWSPDAQRILYHDTHLRLWVLDVASGKATQVDTDPYMVPDRSLNPALQPRRTVDRLLARGCRRCSAPSSSYDVETAARSIQLTDGLADATSPAWDASGKYLWFLASTNFGLASGWLDMASYDKPVTSALYLAVLKKGEPSPLLPESDEETRRRRARRRRAPRRRRTGRPGRQRAHLARGAPRGLDRLRRHRAAHDRRARRWRSATTAASRPGAPGTVFWIENTPSVGTDTTAGPRGGALHRYTIKERKAVPFASNVADFTVSADGHKLLYRTPGAAGGLFIVDADKAPPARHRRQAARCGSRCRWIRAPSSRRSSTKGGGTSATTCT